MSSRSFRRIASLLTVALLVAALPLPAASAAPVTAAVTPASTLTMSDLKSLAFPTASVGYAAGTNGTVVKTTDGGATWTVVRSGDGLDFTGVAFWDAQTGIAVTSSRQVWGTDDGGATWTLRRADMTAGTDWPDAIRVNAMAAVPGTSSSASLVGGDPIPTDGTYIPEQVWHTEMMSPPAGAYWWVYNNRFRDYYIDPPEPYNLPDYYGEGEFFGIDFTDSSRGWVVGADYMSGVTTSSMAATVDGGYTWTRRYLGVATTLKAVSFASTLAGVTTSSDGRAFYTTNGGTTWTEGSRPAYSSLDGVSMVSASVGWAVGVGGSVYKTTTGGATWSSGVSGTTNDLLAIANTGATSWVAVGKTGTIIRTTDGNTWTEPSYVPVMTGLSSATHPVAGTWYANNAPSFSWSASAPSGIAGYSWVLDQTPGTVPDTIVEGTDTTVSYAGKADGTWYFHVRVVDSLGQWSDPLQHAVKIDLTKPSTSDDAAGPYASNVTVTLTPTDASSGIAATYWTLDGTPGTGTSVSVTTEGNHHLEYASVDVAGNRETSKTADFLVDKSGPSVSGLSSATHPVASTWYSNANPSFSWSGADTYSAVAGYSYVLTQSDTLMPDAIAEGSATTTSFAGVADGVWNFRVRGIDALGNAGGVQSVQVRIDTTKPSTTDNHDAVYTSAPAVITLTPTDAHSGVTATYWTLDDVEGSGTSVSTSVEGDHVLRYASVDAAGNRETSSTVYFSLDLSAPAIASLSSATHPDEGTWYANDAPSFSWSASAPSGIAGYSWVLDQSETTVPDTVSEGTAITASFPGTADGVWYFHVRAVNGLARWGSTAHRAVKIDLTKPSTSDNAAGPYASNVTVTLTPTDASSGIAATYWTLDGTPGTGTSVSVTTEGNHHLEYASVDVAGNRETSKTADFLVDKSGPSVSGLSSATHPVASTWYSNANPSFSWSGADTYSAVAGYSYVLDQSPSTTPDTTSEGAAVTASFAGKASGTYYFHVRGVDSLGNWGPAQHLQVRVDTTKPVTNAQVTTSPNRGSVTLTATDAHSGLAGIAWSVVGGASGTGGSGTVVTLTGAGTYSVTYRASDIAGNVEAERSVQVVVPDVLATSIAGSNRIDTAILASKTAYPAGASTVVIATGFNWPDALGGAALAGVLDGPILLTDPSALSPAVSGEVARLGATRAVILGGSGAVSTAVESSLKALLGTANVSRVAGSNRYETARKIAEATVAARGSGYDGTAFVATGANFPDALGASPLAAAKGWPIYLVDPRGADTALVASMRAVGVTDAIVLGGTGAVSDAIKSSLQTAVPCSTARLQGADRYDTARVVASYGVASAGLSWDKVAIATGQNFPDALAGGVLQGRSGSVMLLTTGSVLYPAVGSTLTANKTVITEVRFLGGTGAVSQAVRDAVLAAVR